MDHTQDTIDELQSIAHWLACGPQRATDAAAHLGTVTEDFGSNMLVAPTSPLFREANVVRQVDHTTFDPTEEMSHLLLTPVEPIPLTVLTSSFGTAEEIPSLHDNPPDLLFHIRSCRYTPPVTLVARTGDDRAVEFELGIEFS